MAMKTRRQDIGISKPVGAHKIGVRAETDRLDISTMSDVPGSRFQDGATHFVGYCLCGWRGGRHAIESEAWYAANEHLGAK